MPYYETKTLERLQHPKQKHPQYAPHLWTIPTYGKRLQMVTYPNESDLLDNKIIKHIQSIVDALYNIPNQLIQQG